MSDYEKNNQNTGQPPSGQAAPQGQPPPQGGQGPNPGGLGGLGQQIGDSVREALETGDLSRLKDIGPAVSGAIKDASQGPNRPPTGGTRPVYPPPSGPRYQNVPPRQQQMQSRPSWYGGSTPARTGPQQLRPKNNAGMGEVVAGSLGLVAFGTLGLIVAGFASMTTGAWAVAAVFGLLTVGSGGMIAHGAVRHSKRGKMNKYLVELEKKNVQTVKELAASTGRAPEQVVKDLKKGMRKGWVRYVWFDKTETTVMLGENNYHLYLQSEKERARREAEEAERQARLEQDPHYAEMENFRAEGKATLAKIRACNEAIPGDEISEKLSRLEETTGRIFTYVEKYPKKLPDTRRFMSYYLPTTLKLVDKYRQYEEMEVQTPSILHAKADIEQALETIDGAFNNMLDNLFQDDTLDVATDIEVMQAMLHQDGLTGRQFDVEAETDGGPLRF